MYRWRIAVSFADKLKQLVVGRPPQFLHARVEPRQIVQAGKQIAVDDLGLGLGEFVAAYDWHSSLLDGDRFSETP